MWFIPYLFYSVLCYRLLQGAAHIFFLLRWMFNIHKGAKFIKQITAAMTGVFCFIVFKTPEVLIKLWLVNQVIKPKPLVICPRCFYKASVWVLVLNLLGFTAQYWTPIIVVVMEHNSTKLHPKEGIIVPK